MTWAARSGGFLVLAATAALLLHRDRARGLPFAERTGGSGARVVLVLQTGDCPGHREILSAWGARADSSAWRVEVMVLGRRESLEGIRQAIREAGLSGAELAVQRGSGADASLRVLGYRRTPLLVLLDSVGSVRYVAGLEEASTPESVHWLRTALAAREVE